MNVWTVVVIPITLAIISVILNSIDTFGKDHVQKRAWVAKAAKYARYVKYPVCGLILVAISWHAAIVTSGHSGNLEAEGKPAKQTEEAKPDNKKIAHNKAPEKATDKSQPSSVTAYYAPAQVTPKFKNPTPEYIKASYDQAAPEARSEIVKQFEGLHVSWFGTLHSQNYPQYNSAIVGKEPGAFLIVSELPHKRSSRDPIFFWAMPRNAALLKATKPGDRVHVEGVIDHFYEDRGMCCLKDSTVTPIDPADNPLPADDPLPTLE